MGKMILRVSGPHMLASGEENGSRSQRDPSVFRTHVSLLSQYRYGSRAEYLTSLVIHFQRKAVIKTNRTTLRIRDTG